MNLVFYFKPIINDEVQLQKRILINVEKINVHLSLQLPGPYDVI